MPRLPSAPCVDPRTESHGVPLASASPCTYVQIKELTSSYRQLREGLTQTQDLEQGGEWTPVLLDGRSPRRARSRGNLADGGDGGDESKRGQDWTANRWIVAKGLQPGSRYRMRIRFYHDAGGWSSWDDSPCSAWVRTDDGVPDGIDAPQAAPIRPDAIVVRWRMPRGNGSNVVSYHLQRRRLRDGGDEDDSDSDWEEGAGGPDYDWVDVDTTALLKTCIATADAHATRFSDRGGAGGDAFDSGDGAYPWCAVLVDGLRAGTRHQFRVAAHNAVGAGAPSPPSDAAKTLPTPPTQPQAPQPTALSSNKVRITWRPPRSMGRVSASFLHPGVFVGDCVPKDFQRCHRHQAAPSDRLGSQGSCRSLYESPACGFHVAMHSYFELVIVT